MYCEIRTHLQTSSALLVVLEPPYEIHETGWGEFECGIELHFREPRVKPVSFFHLLKLYPLEQGATTTASAHEPVVASSEPVLYERFDEVVGWARR